MQIQQAKKLHSALASLHNLPFSFFCHSICIQFPIMPIIAPVNGIYGRETTYYIPQDVQSM